MLTNINITSEKGSFQYVVEYEKSDLYTTSEKLEYGFSEGVCMLQENHQIVRNENIWREFNGELSRKYIPKQYHNAYIKVYLPDYSVDTYATGTKYALSINIWIKDMQVNLGTYIFNRLDLHACDRVLHYSGERYYECIDFKIVDPFSLIYDDEWADFRNKICKEVKISNFVLNNTVSTLQCTLYPVEKHGEDFVKIDEYVGSHSVIPISTKTEDFLSLKLTTNVWDSLQDQEPSFNCEIAFNDVYSKNLKEYLLETYNISKYQLNYEFVIGNAEDIYLVLNKSSKDNNCVFGKTDISKYFTNRIGWKEGIKVQSSVNILDKDGNIILYLLSNPLPLTTDLLGYFIDGDFQYRRRPIYWIDLNNVNMKNYNLTIPNKVQKTTITVNTPENSKNQLIQPRFFRVSQMANIIIHPSVTENICLNLDAYKSLVDTFLIKIEGCSFKEIGRTNSGVIFKIKGNNLPKKKPNGNYYILNQDSELITSGKYTYEE